MLSFEESFSRFRKVLLEHSLVPSLGSEDGSLGTLFSVDGIQRMIEFASNTYFQHFSLFCHVFRVDQSLERNTHFLSLQNALQQPPLSSAWTEKDWISKLEREQSEKEERDRIEV